VTVDEALALAPVLALLVIDAVASLAALQGLGPEDRPAFVRDHLLAQIQGAEVDATFDGVEAEMKAGG
jgi:hypothetical protein